MGHGMQVWDKAGNLIFDAANSTVVTKLFDKTVTFIKDNANTKTLKYYVGDIEGVSANRYHICKILIQGGFDFRVLHYYILNGYLYCSFADLDSYYWNTTSVIKGRLRIYRC